MKKFSQVLRLTSIIIVWLLALTSCQEGPPAANDEQSVVFSTETLYTPSASKPVLPSTTPKIEPTPLTYPYLQVTYFAETNFGSYGFYAVKMSCLDSYTPCLSEPEMLSEGSSREFLGSNYFEWSPDGKRIVYETVGVKDRSDIFIADHYGRNSLNITSSSNDELYPNWSSDGKYILYSSCKQEGCQIVRTMSDNPINSRTTLKIEAVNSPHAASFFPDSERLVLIGYDDEFNTTHVYIVNFEELIAQQVTQSKLDNYTPNPSADGSMIVFTRDIYIPNSLGGGTNQNLYIMSADGSQDRRLHADENANQTLPAWSQIGNWIAFNSEKYGEEIDIYIIKPDGTNLINITNTPTIREWKPAWRMVTGP